MRENKEIISKTMAYIEEHISETIRLNDIALSVGYSKYHLNRIFLNETGQTIGKYIQMKRLTESANELLARDTSISEVAQNAGYSSQQAYTLAFRQFYGCTPQLYRQMSILKTTNRMRVKMRYSKGSKSSTSYFISKNYINQYAINYFRNEVAA
ncbi:MAG TPA: AraC family transcriptional regulator [Lachnospiraceae bacterium]|nr:AraC family transcriptional regulator [Lachnospiraceae bacterium]